MNKILFPLFAGLSILTTSCDTTTAAQSDRVNLELNLEKGLTYTTEFDMDLTVDVKMDTSEQQSPMPSTTNMYISLEMNTEVLEANPDSYVLKQKFNTFKQAFSVLGQTLEYDSTKSNEDVPPEMKTMFDAILNATITETISKTGESLTSTVTFPNQQNEELTMQEIMVKDFMNQRNTNLALNFYPDRPVQIGDSWTHTKDATTGNPAGTPAQIKEEETLTLKEVDDGAATIDVDSKITGTMHIMTQGLELKGSRKSTIEVDQKTGLPTLIESNFDMKTVADSNNKDIPEMTIQGNISQKINL